MMPLAPREAERVLWQGRPAPRCYTFRSWKQVLAGSALFLLSSFWLMIALQLIRDGYPLWLGVLPLPLIVGSFIFGPLQVLIARWRWPHIFYVLTASRLILPRDSLSLESLVDIKIKKQGAKLASLRITSATGQTVILHCIEHPETLLALLRAHSPRL